MSVRGTNGPSWKIIKRLVLEKKNRYFRKLSRWLLLTITDPDENLDILEEEDEDEDTEEEDFYQEPDVIEPTPELYYSTLLILFPTTIQCNQTTG